jgi:hypothetical protein
MCLQEAVKSGKNSEYVNTKEAFGSSSFRDILEVSISWFLALPLIYEAVNDCDEQSVLVLQAASRNKTHCVRDHIHSSWLRFKGHGMYSHCCPVSSQREDSSKVINGVDGFDEGSFTLQNVRVGSPQDVRWQVSP